MILSQEQNLLQPFQDYYIEQKIELTIIIQHIYQHCITSE